MLIVILAVALAVLLIVAIFHKGSNYEKSRSFMDFDPGVDSDKVGDPKYPNAGMDSVMKHEYLDNLMKDRKD